MILAAGRGERMAAGRNKALLELAGRPLLLHCVETFGACCERLLVVSAAADVADVRALLPSGVLVVAGGATRHGSEWNALQALNPELAAADVVAIHDAARPLVLPADVVCVLATAHEHGAAMLAAAADLPALELTSETGAVAYPTIKVVAADSAAPTPEVAAWRVARAYPPAELWRAQTPQAARAAWLLDAYQRAAAEGFDGTDTAAVLSRAGYPVRIVPATAENPKVTLPADLELAEILLRKR